MQVWSYLSIDIYTYVGFTLKQQARNELASNKRKKFYIY